MRLPALSNELHNINIPQFAAADCLVWNSSNSGSLSLKEAYQFMNQGSNPTSRGKLIWSKGIPPSKSFLVWRFNNKRIPTNEQLWQRGCHMVSICSLCEFNYEITYLFSFSAPLLQKFAFGSATVFKFLLTPVLFFLCFKFVTTNGVPRQRVWS